MDLGFLGGFEVFGEKFRKLPFRITFSTDRDKRTIETYNYNFDHNSHLSDIRELDYSLLPKTADVVIGGFPCTAWSVSGNRGGFSDKEKGGDLYLEMKSVIDHLRPKVFVAENVDGLRSKMEDSDGEVKPALDIILEDFRQSGYDVQYQVLKAVDYGVPQTRVRVIIIGVRSDLRLTTRYPKPTHSKPRALKDAIGDLENLLDSPNAPANHSSKDYSRAKFYPNKKFQGNQKEQADKPAHTVRSEAHGNQYAHYNSVGKDPNNDDMTTWRRLTVRECARIQSFPDTFVFPVSQSAAHHQIGNAVPPVLAWHIAKSVAEMLSQPTPQ